MFRCIFGVFFPPPQFRAVLCTVSWHFVDIGGFSWFWRVLMCIFVFFRVFSSFPIFSRSSLVSYGVSLFGVSRRRWRRRWTVDCPFARSLDRRSSARSILFWRPWATFVDRPMSGAKSLDRSLARPLVRAPVILYAE